MANYKEDHSESSIFRSSRSDADGPRKGVRREPGFGGLHEATLEELGREHDDVRNIPYQLLGRALARWPDDPSVALSGLMSEWSAADLHDLAYIFHLAGPAHGRAEAVPLALHHVPPVDMRINLQDGQRTIRRQTLQKGDRR